MNNRSHKDRLKYQAEDILVFETDLQKYLDGVIQKLFWFDKSEDVCKNEIKKMIEEYHCLEDWYFDLQTTDYFVSTFVQLAWSSSFKPTKLEITAE